ncbi:tRNA-dihydrouridine synthase C [Vibrio ponticus]|nr:tRNA-dihydrouridine synthase C [Vibrio ponticus]
MVLLPSPRYPQAAELFREIRTFNKAAPIVEHLQRYRDTLQAA